jgi:hypothetical protein
MPDIRIERPSRSADFVEIVADIDTRYAATWKRVFEPPSTRTSERLVLAWTLVVAASCRIDDLQQHDEELLAQMEASGYVGSQRVAVLADAESAPERELSRLGAIEAYARPTASDESAHIRLLAEGIEGPFDTDWASVTRWLEDYLASPATADVRKKLVDTGASERHVFIGITYTSPGEVFFSLERGKGLPLRPKLPPEITHVWLMRATSPGGRCLHWSPTDGWRDVVKHWRTE